MFDSKILPKSDEYGTFMHPDIPENFMEWDDFFPNCGFNIICLRFLEEFSEYGYYKNPDQPLFFDSSKCHWDKRTDLMNGWIPPFPSGNDWQMIAKIWCENGPIAFFAQPKSLKNTKKINHRYIIED